MVENSRAPADTQVLVTGATGFVGARVFPALQREGYRVLGGSRNPESARQHYPDREFRRLDLGDGKSVREALEGCQAAVYLVHSMANGKDYEKEERKSATTFREAAADAGLERIIYLGGMPPNGTPSRHLRSRMATGQVLRAGKVPTIELQATMVIGSGSESFRMVRDLAARLPVMLLPAWSKSLTEPIAIADVTFAICAAMSRVPAESREYPLPGPEIVSARDILQRTARLLGRNPRMFYLPLISPKLSSYWIRIVSRGDHHVTDELVEGLRTDILSPDLGFWKYCPEHPRKSFDDAVRASLSEEEESLSTGALLVEHAIERLSPDPAQDRHAMTPQARGQVDTDHPIRDAASNADDDLGRDAASGETALEAPHPRSLKYSLLLLGMSIVWGVLLSQFGQGQIYWIMGPYALVMSLVLMTLRSKALLKRMRPTLKNVGVGVAIGAGMTLATYPAYALAQRFFPELARNVGELYSKSNNELLITALLWVAVIAGAEDLLWRGAWIEALTPRFGRLQAGVLSVLLYAGTQLCSKSFIVGLLALCCGTIWTIQRHYTRSVLSPLISHLIWTPTVILLHPVV